MIPILERLKSADEQEEDDSYTNMQSSSLDENDMSFTHNDLSSEEDKRI